MSYQVSINLRMTQMMMMTLERKLMGPTKVTFGFCSLLPIRLELRMTRAEEERMVRLGCSNSYRREGVHIQLEEWPWGYEGKWDCCYP